MRKQIIVSVLLVFLTHFTQSVCYEKEDYLVNIDKALNFFQFEKTFKDFDHLQLREDLKKVLLALYEKEQLYPNAIHCVTTQDSLFYAYQVIAKEIYQKIHGPVRENFEFLRYPTEDLLKNRNEFFEKFSSLILTPEELAKSYQTSIQDLPQAFQAFEARDELEYLKLSEGEDEGDDDDSDDETPDDDRYAINDTLPEISKQLLSVNFTIETCRPLDSAMFVLLSGKAVGINSLSANESDYRAKFSKLIEELFESQSIPKEKFLPYIEDLVTKAPRSVIGIVNQIFLPRDKLSDFLYISFGGGFLHPIYDAALEKSYDDFQLERFSGNFRLTRNFQGRIIVGSLFHNEEVKIFRHTLIPQEEQKQYEMFVKQVINELFEDEVP